MPFDPDQYLAGGKGGGFNPDAYLAAPPVNSAPQQPPKPVWSGSVLPISEDAQGVRSFDSNAGIIGALKRAITAPADAYSGKMDPMSDEGIHRSFDLAGMMSPLPAPMRAGEYIIPGEMRAVQQTTPKVPTTEALKDAAGAAYDRAKTMGVEYSSDAVKGMADNIKNGLESDGIIAELSPKTFAILGKLQSPPDGSVATLSGLDAARKSLGHAAGDFTNKTEQLAAKRVIERLDEFMGSSDPATLVDRAPPASGDMAATLAGHDFAPADAAYSQGNAQSAGQALQDARGNYAAAMRSDRITGAQDRAELNAAVANSGQNIDNAVRQRLRDLLVRPKEARGYSPEELAAVENIARGSMAQNLARGAGNLMGGGGGLGGAVTSSIGASAGASTGSPMATVLGASLPLAGYASKKLANALTMRQVDALDEMVRSRSPLYQKMKQNAPSEVTLQEKRAALARILAFGSTTPQ